MNSKQLSLSALLEISTGSIVSVVGCGGKTSITLLLASQNSEKKVLISPTTKILPMNTAGVTLCDTLESSIRHVPQQGIQCLGQLNKQSGKLEALPEHVLADLIPLYDIVLMEADGSRGLPCKGWRENEPVVLPYSTHTVGIVTMAALGKEATSETVHRLPEFLSLTGLRESRQITEQALEDMACLPDGMFKGSAGQQYLLVNRVENKTTIQIAEFFLKTIKVKYPGRFKRLIFGSVRRDMWYEA